MKIILTFLFLCSMLGVIAKEVNPEFISLTLKDERLSGINMESLWGVDTKTSLINGDTLEIVFIPVYRGGTPIDIVIPPEAKKIKIFGVEFDLPKTPGDTRIQSYLLENIVSPWHSFDHSESLRLVSMITMYPHGDHGQQFVAKNQYIGQSGNEQWFMSMQCSGIVTADGGVFLKSGNRGADWSGYHKSIDFFNHHGKLGIYTSERLRYYKGRIEKRSISSFDIPMPDVQLLTLVKLNQPYVEKHLERLEKVPPIDQYYRLPTLVQYRKFLTKIESLEKGMAIEQVYSYVFDDPSFVFIYGNKFSYPLVKKRKDWIHDDTDIYVTFEFESRPDGEMGLSAIY